MPAISKWTPSGIRVRRLVDHFPSVPCRAIAVPLYGLLLGLAVLGGSFALTASAADGDTVTAALPIVVPDEFNGDLSKLPFAPVTQQQPRERPYRPLLRPPAPPKTGSADIAPEKEARTGVAIKAAMPSPAQNFAGIALTDTCTGGQCGGGVPPDPNGEVGPNHYIQGVNTAYGIYNKTGTLLASFTENNLWSGNGTICNGQSQGDPIVVYDALADRWILTHFAFGFSGANPTTPYYQCIAVSKTADPVAGGWWLYPVLVSDASHPWLNDYGKFGIWTDCLYMSANEFTGAGAFQGTLFASFSRADMYAGLPLTSSIGYLGTTGPFTMLPSHLGGQSGAALPAGTPNFYVSNSATAAFDFEVRKFTAGPNCGAGGTLSAPVIVSQTSYATWTDPVVPQPGTTTKLDAVGDRLMQKAQYRKVGAAESLWVVHSYRTSASGNLGLQWAQINVTGGTISAAPAQLQNYSPDATLYRFMPSLAVDGLGNMAVAYSTSNGTAPNYPSIAYSGRLVGDPINTLPQTETQLIAGGSSQTGTCGGAACDRWGDYTSMSVDPFDDCTFWLTNEYYPGPFNANTIAWHTRIGSFKFPSCSATNRTADLAITKTDGATTVAPGASIAYTIVVTNNGPFAVTGATVTDTVPAAITGVTWTCVASAGNSCPSSGSGSISTSAVNLMKGSTATFTIHGTVSPSASGTLANTATVAVPAGFTDPVPGNNTATDTDTIGSLLSPPTIGKVFGTSPIVVGQASLLTMTIANPNAGSALTGVAFSDSLPAGVTAPNASGAGCGGTVTVSSNVISLTGGTLAASGNCTIPVTVTGAQAQVAQWVNTINSVTSTEAGTNSTPATANITVNKATTTTAIVSDLPDPSVVGQPYTVTYNVSVTAPGAGTPTGAVTVSDGVANCIGTLPATSCQLASTSFGPKSLTATYNGDANFGGSVSATAAHQVNQAATATAIVSDVPDPTVVGQPYTVTYAVSVTAPGTGTPSGTVTVSDGAVTCLGTLPTTSCQLASTSIGAKSLTATYNGDANFGTSVSATAAHQVNKAAATTTIVSDLPDPSVVGQAYTVTYSVVATAPGAGTPSGTVTVSDGTDNCIGTLPATSCQLVSTTFGAKSLTATYSGDGNFNSSVSATAAHQVNKAATTTTIVSGLPDPSVVGQAYTVTYSLSVTAPGAGTLTGTVTVSDGSSSCIGTLPATTCLLTSTTAGSKSLIATYGSDVNFNGSASAAAAHQVNKAATATAILSDAPDPSLIGQPYIVTYSVSVTAPGAGAPTGTVTVTDGTDNCFGTLPATSCQVTSSTPGIKVLDATYSGDANFSTSTAPGAAHVVKANTTTAIVSALPNPSDIGQAYTVTFGVSVNPPGSGIPTGTVSVSDGAASCLATLPATSCQLTSASIGTKNLTASYGGDANFNASTSAAASHQVIQISTTTAIVSDVPDPSVVGTAVAVSVSVSVTPPGTGTPTGSIAVSDGVDGCTIPLPSTSCNWTPTTLGARNLVGTYGGDATFSGSVSAAEPHEVVVDPNNSTLTVTRSGSGGGTVGSDDLFISCGATCSHIYPNGTTRTLSASPDAGSVFTGWLGPCTGTGPCTFTINAPTTVSATFALAPLGSHILDIDGDGTYDALTDGLMVLRYLSALTGTSVSTGAVTPGAPRSDPNAITSYLGDVKPMLDIDGNGQADAPTDGLLIIRYLFGLRGTDLIQGAVGAGAARLTPADIENYILSLLP